MKTKLERIAEISSNNKDEKFNNIIHLINEDLLKECHKEMPTNKATGVDKVDKQQYEERLEENIKDLWSRLKSFSYKPQPIRRTYIPKAGSEKLRPLGIPAYEDRLVQLAMSKILTAIYEPIFEEFSYGFREERGCHQALSALTYLLENKPIRYIVDADIKSFFDTMNHNWMIQFLEHKVTDPKFIRLVKRVLKTPVMEKGMQTTPEAGAIQGGQISPILSNIYLHYVLDLWFEKRIKKGCRYSAHMVRYADDYACCFESEFEAREFYRLLEERLEKFGLELAKDKSKIIKFGRYAEADVKKDNKSKPKTFDFLGFTHYCSRSKDGKRFRVKRLTSKKKRSLSCKKIKEWIILNRHERPIWLFKKLNQKLVGYYNYYGITDNGRAIQRMRRYVQLTLFKALRRRSNRNRLTWESFQCMEQYYTLAKATTRVNIYKIIPTLATEKL